MVLKKNKKIKNKIKKFYRKKKFDHKVLPANFFFELFYPQTFFRIVCVSGRHQSRQAVPELLTTHHHRILEFLLSVRLMLFGVGPCEVLIHLLLCPSLNHYPSKE